MKENIAEIKFSNLEETGKSLFIKLFKKPATWKKANAVIFIARYKFSDGKKIDLVAIPFKKKTEAMHCFKHDVKKAASFKSKLTSVAALSYGKDDDGNLSFQITPIQGGLNLDYLDSYGKELFSKLKTGFKVVGSDEVLDTSDLKEVLSVNDEKISDQKLTNIIAKQKVRKEKLGKIQDNISKLEIALAKDVEPQKIEKTVTQYENVLKDMGKEAMEDGHIDNDEKDAINSVKEYITKLKLAVKVVPEINRLFDASVALIKEQK
jgi:hypothetical protein